MLSWIAQLPSGVLYGCLGIIGLALIGGFALGLLTLIKGGKIKAGPVELDTEEEHMEAPK